MLQYINYRMRVTTKDGRCLVGKFLAFDRHMNIVLAQTEEFRAKRKRDSSDLAGEEQKRTLGLVLLRGENVVSLQVDSPPKKKKVTAPQPGRSVAVANPIVSQPQSGLGRGQHF